jgi:hypothetical protein
MTDDVRRAAAPLRRQHLSRIALATSIAASRSAGVLKAVTDRAAAGAANHLGRGIEAEERADSLAWARHVGRIASRPLPAGAFALTVAA